MVLNAEHKRPPRELLRGIALIRILARKYQEQVPGVTVGVLYNAQYYVQGLVREWLNLKSWQHHHSFQETWMQTAQKIWNFVITYHDNKLQDVNKYIQNIADCNDELDVYATLPFDAPRGILTKIEINLHHARCAFTSYWHLDGVVDWSYTDLITMLNTGQYVEAAADHRDDTSEAG